MGGSITKHFLLRLSIGGAGLFPMLSGAVGLSDIQLESRLNQPLQARIEITGVGDEEWPRIHASLNRNPLDDTALHPELLDSITLRTMEDAGHRHFLEVRSREIFTEPMFDLSVEVSGSATRVIRSYTVLLDPPGANDDAPRRLADTQTLSTPQVSSDSGQPSSQRRTAKRSSGRSARGDARHDKTASAQPDRVYIVNKSDTLERIARHLGAHSAAQRRHLMQWIFEHNPQAFYGDIHHLHARAQLLLPEETPASGVIAANSQPTPATQSAQHSAEAPKSPAGTSTGPAPQDTAAQAELTRHLAALQDSLQTMQEKISAQNAQIAHLTAQIAARVQTQAAPTTPASGPDAEDADDEETASPPGRWGRYSRVIGGSLFLLVGLVALVFMWRRRPSGTTPVKSIVANSELGQQRTVADTSARRPAVTAPNPRSQAPVGVAKGDRKPATPTEAPVTQDGHSVANKEAAAILENSLGEEPHRVDIRLKLLEIYHHEVQGNRAEFNSMLSQLVADPKALTADQRSHVEKLQRTLSDDEAAARTEFVAKVAI